MEIQDIAKAAYDWAEQDDSKRTVLFLTSEKKNETEEGYSLVTSKTANGKTDQMIVALVDAMKDDKVLARVITRASIEYSIAYTMAPVGIGIISNEGKEGKDE